MDKICDFLALEWSAQDGEIQVIKKGGVNAEAAVLLNKETELIDYPRREANTLTEKKAAESGIKYGQKGVVRTVVDADELTAKMPEWVTLEIEGDRISSACSGNLSRMLPKA